LLRPIFFPAHICGGVRARSVLDNGKCHMHQPVVVTIDIRQCFPSISNIHVYHVWRNVLGCSTPVSKMLTRLTTFKRRLPQGSPVSPLLANLFILSIDQPIRAECAEKNVSYSTWIDDLAFSGVRARELIETAATTLAQYGLNLSRRKIKIMGPEKSKVLTGVRLGCRDIRAPREKIARIRSGIHKLRSGLIKQSKLERYVGGLVGQLIYVEFLCPRDASKYGEQLAKLTRNIHISSASKKFLAKFSRPSVETSTESKVPAGTP
jgi:hypothetical protein